MKKLIDEAVKLASEYKKFGTEVKLKNGYTNLTRLKNRHAEWEEDWIIQSNIIIQVYFADNYDTFSICLDDIEIRLYANKISIPFTITTSEFDAIIIEARRVLSELNEFKLQEVKSAASKHKEERIKMLEEELKTLKSI